MSIIAINKRAKFDYELLQTLEAGLILLGHEVKSIKTGHIDLKGSYIVFKEENNKLPKVYLVNTHIPIYKYADKNINYDPYRSRELLLQKKQIKKILELKKAKSLTIVPIKVYTKGSLIKIEIALAKGKKKADKREVIRKREVDKKIRREMKNKL